MRKALAGLALLTAAAAGCHPYVPPAAIVANAGGPIAVTSNPGGTKTGRASAHGVLGIASWGDASAAAAMRAGGIARVQTVDVEALNVLGIYYRYTTVVTGE